MRRNPENRSKDFELQRRALPSRCGHWHKGWVIGCALALILGLAQPCRAECSEKPTVMLDESTAATHLTAKKDPQLPINMTWEAIASKVILRLTVDRRGNICEVRPLTGPPELTKLAVETVKKHWRYRPFRINWKPVVAQFPVTVRFVPRKREPRRTIT